MKLGLSGGFPPTIEATRPTASVKSHKYPLFFLCFFSFIVQSNLFIGVASAHEDDHKAQESVNSISNIWRQVREGVSGYSAVSGQETNVLIQASGQNWRQLRNGPIATYAVWLLGATGSAIAVFFLLRGKVKLTKPRSGRMMKRWSVGERLLHWFTATIFVVLSVTGLGLLYGRAVLIPVLGKAEFATYADIAKTLHNVLGPTFIAGLLLMMVCWFKDNLPNRIDFQWFMEFGGLVGDKHPSAGRMNGGEKLWFWLLASAGIAVCISGLILDFPNFGQDRLVIQISHLIHLILAMVLIIGALGHIYIGTIGTEGAFEGMISGKVDESWAEQHHDLWFEEARKEPDGFPEASIDAGNKRLSE